MRCPYGGHFGLTRRLLVLVGSETNDPGISISDSANDRTHCHICAHHGRTLGPDATSWENETHKYMHPILPFAYFLCGTSTNPFIPPSGPTFPDTKIQVLVLSFENVDKFYSEQSLPPCGSQPW